MKKLLLTALLSFFVVACSSPPSIATQPASVEVSAEPTKAIREVVLKSDSFDFVVMRDLDGSLIDKIPVGTICELLDTEAYPIEGYRGTWYSVNCQGRLGYVPVNCTEILQ